MEESSQMLSNCKTKEFRTSIKMMKISILDKKNRQTKNRMKKWK